MSVGIASMLCSENFIVKKAKQAVVSYDDQWCDLFGTLMQELAEFDVQRGSVQKKGIQEIMKMVEGSKDCLFSELPKSEQQAAITQLQKVVDNVHAAAESLRAYNKTITTLFSPTCKIKK